MSGKVHGETEVNAEHLNRGIYFLHISNGNASFVEKVVIE